MNDVKNSLDTLSISALVYLNNLKFRLVAMQGVGLYLTQDLKEILVSFWNQNDGVCINSQVVRDEQRESVAREFITALERLTNGGGKDERFIHVWF